MAITQNSRLLKQIQRLFDAGALASLGESQLLDRFVVGTDEAAFGAIVARYGPMVLGVCRRQLRDPNDVEDAFQATFLILVKKAPTLRDPEGLGPWLHGVARRVASRARTQAANQSKRLRGLSATEMIGPPTDRGELLSALDEEIERLPEALRLPIVLCHIEGCSYEQAALRLHWSEGMVRGRLARGRERLRERLSRRGLAPIAEGRNPEMAPTVPPALFRSTLTIIASRGTVGAIPAAVSVLVEGVSESMILMKLKTIPAVALALGLLVSGAFVLSAQEPPRPPAHTGIDSESNGDSPPDLRAVRKALKDWWETLRTLSFREEEYSGDAKGRRDASKGFLRLEFALAPANRFACDIRSIKPDRSEVLFLKKRWDGDAYYHFYPASNTSAEIRCVTESPQREPRERYDGEMSDVLWLILPTHPLGRPPAVAPLDQGASLKVERDPQGHYHVLLIDDKNLEFRAELDPDHGWMPKLVQIGTSNVFRATRFILQDGHWFPIQGSQTTLSSDGASLTIPFEVTDLRINQPIANSEFNLADFPSLRVVPGNE
jgi:RNA polymerase sigma factor (sigma-70 family)